MNDEDSVYNEPILVPAVDGWIAVSSNHDVRCGAMGATQEEARTAFFEALERLQRWSQTGQADG